MNIATFLGHYQLLDDPFRAEEARHDAVFSRVETACHHPDYEKIRGEFTRPSSAIVFGERGSGKTAIRLQIEDEAAQHNRDNPDARCLVVAYDDLNPVLDRLSRNVKGKSPGEALRQMRLVDHIDAMLGSIVPRIVDAALGQQRDGGPAVDLGERPIERLRNLPVDARRDLLALQMCYDRPERAADRTGRFKRLLRVRSFNSINAHWWLAAIAAALAIVLGGYLMFLAPQDYVWAWYAGIGLCAIAAIALAGRAAVLSMRIGRVARDVTAQLRTIDRSVASMRQSLRAVSVRDAIELDLPRTDDDDLRYAMLNRLLRAMRPLGYRSMLVLVDRVDEPTLINGEPERMRAVVWPMLNSKFLQQDGIGIKLLLPLELRYLLDRESAEFYRAARLDKQNLIEKLEWSGAVLYDLCTARLNACRPQDASPMSLSEMFEDSVSAQDLIDALDQMRQPRDAFKFLYQIIHEHCANTPEDRPVFKIPRPVLDAIRKQQVERVTGMLRGVRPT